MHEARLENLTARDPMLPWKVTVADTDTENAVVYRIHREQKNSERLATTTASWRPTVLPKR